MKYQTAKSLPETTNQIKKLTGRQKNTPFLDPLDHYPHLPPLPKGRHIRTSREIHFLCLLSGLYRS